MEASFDSGETKWTEVKEACELEIDNIEANLDNYREALLLHKLHEYQSMVFDFSKIQLNSWYSYFLFPSESFIHDKCIHFRIKA